MTTLTIEEAAELVGLSTHAVKRWVDRGYLRPVRPGAKPVRFHESDVVECHYLRMPQTRHAALDALWADVLAECERNVGYSA